MTHITRWNPSSVLSKEGSERPYCLIILNQPIIQAEAFHCLWTNASFRFVADGGANRLYDAFKHDQDVLEQYLPDEIRGDLDSMKPHVRQYYETKNVKITKVHEQNSTDFMKCIVLLKEKEKEKGQIYDIVATAALGGRFDQTMSSINLLYKIKDEVERRCILINYQDLTILLDKGQHEIHCTFDFKGPTCGLIPFGGPATLTTKGLKWDLDGQKCYFGGLLSTSNIVKDKTIHIETDAPVVWTMEIKYK